MSTQASATALSHGTTNGVSHDRELDVPKLHSLSSEQQDLYLLTFTTHLTHHVSSLDKEAISDQQLQIKRELLKIVTLSSPQPSRVIRNNLGKCFRELLGRGNRSTLYETVNELLGLLGPGKSEKELRLKHAAVHCLGEVYAAAGESALSLSGFSCSGLIKTLKGAQNYTGLRASIYKALGKVVTGAGSGVDETTAREIWKNARGAASADKSFLVQSNACWCLEQLTVSTLFFDNSNDFDALKTTIWKAIETPASVVRHAAASCLAATLVKSYSEEGARDAMPKIRKPKKPSKKHSTAIEDGEEIERPSSPSPKKTAVQLSLSLREILRQLSFHYLRQSVGPKGRTGIASCYRQVLVRLNGKVIEEQYSQIASHFFVDLLSHPAITFNRYRLLLTRKLVKHLLEEVVGRRILGEGSQLNAVRWLVNDVLKNYPQAIQDRPEPGKHTLTASLSALASLLSSLGSAVAILGDACREGLLQVLQHPSYTVQIHTSYCLRNFVLACPQQLLSCLTICMNSLNRELNNLGGQRHSPRRCVGYANGLAAMLSTSRLQPLYGSVDVYSRVLSMATELLKSSSSSELRVSATQVQVAWILIGGLMPLGPSFVKIHLAQLLLLWKNALPRPLTRENMAQRGNLEMSFLTHVRECALGSILAFLEFNSRLVTTDGSKRIANMLQNTIMFLESLPPQRSTEDISQRLSPSLQLHDLAMMARRRVLQCYSKLVQLTHLGHSEVLSQSNLLSLALSSFADPESDSHKTLEASLANSASSFENLWDVADNWGSGVTGMVRGFQVKALAKEHSRGVALVTATIDSDRDAIDESLVSPICQAREHDSVLLYCLKSKHDDISADPPATEVVNAAIELFAVSLPLQGPKIQESTLEQMATLLSVNSLQRNPGRKAAMTVNLAVALLNTLKVAIRETQFAPGDLRSTSTEKIIQELLRKFIIDPDPTVRSIAAEAMGRLCNSGGNSLTGSEINNLIETIVANRDPSARAGCALALGCIHSQVGGMAAGFHLKTIVGVLMSLCSDPHPVVHFWALEGLTRVVDSAGLTFSGYVSGTLGMLAQLYITDSHNEEAVSLTSSNAETELCSTVLFGRGVDALINVLGPDLQDMSKARDLIFTLVRQFQSEDKSTVVVQGLKCLEHLSLYAPGLLDYELYVRQLQTGVGSSDPEIRKAALRGLNNLMKRDAEAVLKTASPGLEDEFWLAVDYEPGHSGITNIIRNWLLQTALSDTNAWIQRCQNVLTKVKVKAEEPAPSETVKTAGVPELQDEEVAGFANAAGTTQGDAGDDSKVTQELLKWQTRTFAMSCMSELLSMVSKEALADHTIPAETALQQRIGDIVRMAFSASTANVVELRVLGLKIIDQILNMFGKTPDPDFSEASLLEQYQAQIGSALTPAFAADSSPELASEAINVCASFVATGIVTNVDRMGRIFKLLVTAIENFAGDSETTAIGDLKGLSSNARVMVKMAVFSAWAQLQIASSEQTYLVEIVQPYTAKLTPLWLSSLQEFARLRFEPEISSTVGNSTSGSLDDVYAALNRETLLKFYQDSWLNLVDAIASLVELDSDFVFDALDGKLDPDGAGQTESPAKGSRINYREEPVAFFFVLFGLAFEALVGQANNSPAQNMEVLQALKKILRPPVSGNAIYQDAVFTETMDSLDRLVLTEGSEIQTVIVEIARNLSLDHLSGKGQEDRDEKLSDDIEQLFELTRIIILVLAGLMPNLGESAPRTRHSLNDDTVLLIQLSLTALVDVADVFPSIIRADLHACIIHVFCTILATGVCQADVVPRALPIFKRFIQSVTKAAPASESSESRTMLSLQIRGCLRRCLTILSHAQRRETESSLPCAKNTLLTTTLLITAGGSSVIPPNDELITRLLSEMLDCLGDVGLAKVAVNCIRSLMIVPSKNVTDEAIARTLLPHLLLFVANPDPDTDPEKVRGLVAQILTNFVSTLDQDKRPTAVSIVIPALLQHAVVEGEKIYKETASRLLELAGAGQLAFRAAVGQMGLDQRAFMEGMIRGGGAVGAGGDEESDGEKEELKPTIELRMDF